MNKIFNRIPKAISLLLCPFVLAFSITLPALSAEDAEVKIPVLLYHVVSENPDPSNIYQMNLTEFKKQMAYLNSNGYTTLSLDEYAKILDKKIAMPKNSILLTFDDCTSDFMTNVLPILNQYKMNATQFVVTNWLDNGSIHMTTNDVQSLDGNIDVQCHTANHERLTYFDYDLQLKIIRDSQSKLKSITKKEINCLAYPYGDYDQDTIKVLKKLGFSLGFAVSSSISTSTSNRYALPRIVVSQNDTLASFTRKVMNGN
jgi:peptidoglycan/xylan/chitin deacetylase (PgdA/CDA1 family)